MGASYAPRRAFGHWGAFGAALRICLRLQNVYFVWCAFFPPAPSRSVAVAFGAALWAALVGAHTAAAYFFCRCPFSVIFFASPLDTRLALCYTHRRSDGGRMPRPHLLYHKRPGLVKPRSFVFSRVPWQDPPTTLGFGLVEGGRGVCFASGAMLCGLAGASRLGRPAFGARRL